MRPTSALLKCPAAWVAPWLFATACIAAEPRLAVEPAAITLDGPRQSGQAVATLHLTDGGQQDVTQRAVWRSSNESVARSQSGRLAATGNGMAQLEVSLSDASLGKPLTASVAVTVQNFDRTETLNFRRDLEPILSKQGCNSGSCHGKLAGQNGFRLSLFGFDPAADYNALTKEGRGRRIFPAAPEQSLLLKKGSAQLPHGGGRRIEPGSAAYRTLAAWIEQGAPWGEQDLADHEAIEVYPRQRTLEHAQRQQLRVVLRLKDGNNRDVTADAEYRSQRPELLQADPSGLVTALVGAGESTVLVRYLGLVDIARFSVPFSKPATDEAYRNFQAAGAVDAAVLAKWRKLGIVPSGPSSDSQFLRRVMLDCIGRLPTPDEVRAFAAEVAPDKRARLIDNLLERPEFADYWALRLADLLQNRKERDHDVRGAKNVRLLHQWLRAQLAAHRPWDEIARAVLTAQGESTTSPQIGYYVVNMGEQNAGEQSELITSVAQAFLGTRLGCAKCHNHPLEKYTQDDYYHFAAFFSRLKLERQAPEKGPTKLSAASPDPNQNTRPVGATQPRTGQYLPPQVLDRTPITIDPGQDPREKLAAWVTDPKNEYFSGAMVNRLVEHFLGVGLVTPVDDLRATNPPTNLELWQVLNREFVEKKFDLKHLIRAIISSQTYQLDSTTRPENAADLQFYSHYYVRRLPAEVLLDALSQSTGVPETFAGYPLGVRAVQVPDPGLSSQFLSLFGRSTRTTACACERRGDVTLPQLLHLENGDSVVQKINDARGRLAELRSRTTSPEAAVQELFLATFSRLPQPQELAAIAPALQADATGEGLQDLFWALLNSKEFGFNH